MDKRYVLFAGYTYYPQGGWLDVQGRFDKAEDALHFLIVTESHFDWWQVVDLQTDEIVEEKSI